MIKLINKAVFGVVFLLFGTGLSPSTATAGLVTIDVDPTTPGVQDSLDIALGDSFDIDIVFLGDGGSVFEFFGVGIEFDPAVLADSLLPGSRTAGDVALGSPFAVDIVSFLGPIAPGNALQISGAEVGLESRESLTGVITPFLDPATGTPYAPGSVIVLVKILGLEAIAEGSTSIGFTANSGGSLGLDFDDDVGTISVSSSGAGVVPEPGALAIWGFGVAAMMGVRRRKHRRTTA